MSETVTHYQQDNIFYAIISNCVKEQRNWNKNEKLKLIKMNFILFSIRKVSFGQNSEIRVYVFAPTWKFAHSLLNLQPAQKSLIFPEMASMYEIFYCFTCQTRRIFWEQTKILRRLRSENKFQNFEAKKSALLWLKSHNFAET